MTQHVRRLPKLRQDGGAVRQVRDFDREHQRDNHKAHDKEHGTHDRDWNRNQIINFWSIWLKIIFVLIFFFLRAEAKERRLVPK